MDFLKNNSIWLGMGIAMIFPIMVFGIVLMLFEIGTDMGLIDSVADPMKGRRLRTTTLITLCGNMILIKFYNKRFTQDTLRGVLIITFIAAATWLGFFYNEVFADF